MNLQISRAQEVPATWSDLPLPPGWKACLGPSKEEGEGRGGPPFLPFPHPFAAVPGHWVSAGLTPCVVLTCL